CRIFDKDRKLVGKINESGGLYRVVTPRAKSEFAGAAKQKKTIDELHRAMGHVAHEAARKLVKNGLIEGVELDESSKASICESCEFAKMSRKLIQKFREAPCAENIGDELHSDVWGPTPVRTMHHKEYYFSFTDD
ncbi:hypothetical protein C8J57DRAFT_975295, partial [Mycena rebaudengoi]